MKNRLFLNILIYMIVISVSLASFICYQRITVEKENNVIELIIDYTDAENLALNEGIGVEDVIKKFQQFGITTVAITENTLIDLEKERIIEISPGYLLGPKAYRPERIYVFVKDMSYRTSLIKGLSAAFGKNNINIHDNTIELSATIDDIFQRGIGISKIKAKTVQQLGLDIIPRSKNSYNLDNDMIKQKIDMAKALFSFSTIIFDGEEVLGYPNYIKETSRSLKESMVRYGYIELAKQNGDSMLLAHSGLNFIKLHSISADELQTMSRDEVIQRYIRAAQDRSIRMLYIHSYPYPDKGAGLLNTNLSMTSEIIARLQKIGFGFGKASSPAKLQINQVALMVLALGVSASVILFLSYFIEIDIIFSICVFIITILLTLMMGSVFAKKMFALITSVAFPIFAVVSQYIIKKESVSHNILTDSIFMVLYMVGITFTGGILITGLLSDQSFMMGVNQFSGVKIALLLPVLTVFAYFFLRDDAGHITLKNTIEKLSSLLNIKITIMNASLMLAGLMIAALLILRSGNFGIGIPVFEKIFRSILEISLAIRPRTKEFLIGYPALLLGTIYYLKGGKIWLPVWASIGILALVSMTNTFCHIHSPITVTIIRSIYGLILGLIIGLMIYGAYSVTNWIVRKSKNI